MMNQPPTDKENFSVPKSPNFIRPKPLCLRRKPRKLLECTNVLQPLNRNVQEKSTGNIPLLTRSPLNPFRIREGKRKRNLDSSSEDCSLLSRCTKNKVSEKTSSLDSCRSSVTPSLINEDAHFGCENVFRLDEKNPETAVTTERKILPVDWSLKTKVRLTSVKPFPWRCNFKTSEEASGITSYVRCLHHEDDKKRCNLDSSHGAKFFQHCLVWMHPSLPWINLFPRVNFKSAVKKGPISFPMSEPMREVLNANWSNSFRSLFQLLRTCQCPYFYMCAPTFNVLFRSGGVSSLLDTHAIITPTTRGLRDALKEEGIEFTMPLNKSAESHDSNQKTNKDKNGETEDDIDDSGDDDDDDPGLWLESMGLSQDDFPSLYKSESQREHEKYKHIDNHPASLVYIDGPETQALINFLLNTTFCVEKTGPMAGIPPTLLSPIAFLGATLHSHKIRHGKILQDNQELHSVEVTGPLLPNTIHSLCSLLDTTQEGSFGVSLTDYPPTSPYSKLARADSGGMPAVFATENLKDCGLPQAFVHQMCSRIPIDKGGVSNITVENGSLTWT